MKIQLFRKSPPINAYREPWQSDLPDRRERTFPKHGDENPNCNEALFIAFFVCSERIFLKHGGAIVYL